jgi:hypothetical protein
MQNTIATGTALAPEPSKTDTPWDKIFADLEARRLRVSQTLNTKRKTELGQFLTPVPIAKFMAGMIAVRTTPVTMLDPGAGIGSLSAAFLQGDWLSVGMLTYTTQNIRNAQRCLRDGNQRQNSQPWALKCRANNGLCQQELGAEKTNGGRNS